MTKKVSIIGMHLHDCIDYASPVVSMDYTEAEKRIASIMADNLKELAKPRDIRDILGTIATWAYREHDLFDDKLLVRWEHANVEIQAGIKILSAKDAQFSAVYGGLVERAVFCAKLRVDDRRVREICNRTNDLFFPDERNHAYETVRNPLHWWTQLDIYVALSPTSFDVGTQAKINAWAERIATYRGAIPWDRPPPMPQSLVWSDW